MLGIPLPARSPISIRLNIFINVVFLGSDTPPLMAASISILKLPGFEKEITSFLLLNIADSLQKHGSCGMIKRGND